MSSRRNFTSKSAAAPTPWIQCSTWLRRDSGLRAASVLDLLPQPPGEVLDKLPGDAAGARAPGHRPFHGLGPQRLVRHGEAITLRVALDDGEVGVLVAVVEAEPEAESVG